MAKKAAKKKRPKKRYPKVALMIPCDAISRDPSSGKATLYGLFNVMFVAKFPTIFPTFSVFSKLADGAGKHLLNVAVLDPDGNLVEGTGVGGVEVELNTALMAEISVQVARLNVKKAGKYSIQMRSGNRDLGNPCTLTVAKIKAPKKNK